MPPRRETLVLSLAALLGGALGPGWARAAAIVGVRMWPARDYTRLTIESDTALTARHRLNASPPQLLIEIDQLELSPPLAELVGKVQPDDPYIAGVRVGSRPGGKGVRLLVELKVGITPQQFTLAPVAAYQHRLVFDLHPLQPPDPLLALLQERERQQRVAVEAAASVQDALGDFIRGIERPPAGMVGMAGTPASAPSPGAARAASPAPPASAPAASPSVLASTAAGGHANAGLGAAAGATRQAGQPPQRPPSDDAEALALNRLVVVALDPGHGGEDPGAVGPGGLKEKDAVLAIALKVRDKLNAVRGMQAMMTRDDDFFVPLHERVAKARRVQADLLVSIHADAFITPEARGASVFALSERGASSAAARWLAAKENQADLVGGLSMRSVRDKQVVNALLDMSTAAQIKDSLKLAREVLAGFGRIGRLHKRGVEQAGFAVLKAPDVPSILVETAFISNPEEEARLADPAWREQAAEAIAAGIRRYFARNPPLAAGQRTV